MTMPCFSVFSLVFLSRSEFLCIFKFLCWGGEERRDDETETKTTEKTTRKTTTVDDDDGDDNISDKIYFMSCGRVWSVGL